MKRTNLSDFLTGKSLLSLRIIANLSNRKSTKGYPVNISSTSLVDGFTMLELMIVVFMIGILSAIAAPSWDAFTTKQRVKAVNNQVLRSLMTAQSEAKLRKTPITVEFNPNKVSTTDPPTIDIKLGVPSALQPLNSLPKLKPQPIKLDGEGEIKLGMIKMSVNGNDTDVQSLSFNYDGTLTEGQSLPFSITIASKAGGTKECVRVQTILGAMITGSDNYDATNNPTGCP